MFSRTPDLAGTFRHLLQVVTDALGAERRRGLLAGPLALLMWMRTRRMRKEREEALAQFRVLIEEFLALLEDFRAGKLAPATAEPDTPPGRPPAQAAATPRRGGATQRPRRAGRGGHADLQAQHFVAAQQWLPGFAGMLDGWQPAADRRWIVAADQAEHGAFARSGDTTNRPRRRGVRA